LQDLESIDWSAFKSDSSGCIEYGLVEVQLNILKEFCSSLKEIEATGKKYYL